jgi:hypothetical protein
LGRGLGSGAGQLRGPATLEFEFAFGGSIRTFSKEAPFNLGTALRICNSMLKTRAANLFFGKGLIRFYVSRVGKYAPRAQSPTFSDGRKCLD